MDKIDKEFQQLLKQQKPLSLTEQEDKNDFEGVEWTDENIRRFYSALLNKFSGTMECIFTLKQRENNLRRQIRDFEKTHQIQESELPTVRNASDIFLAVWE